MLERENAAILNESLKGIAKKVLASLQSKLQDGLGLQCPVYLAQNDGTVCSMAYALQYPVVTFASGPTNSMRGAAFLSGLKSGLVIDIGGTSTDVGVLVDGFPREASSHITVLYGAFVCKPVSVTASQINLRIFIIQLSLFTFLDRRRPDKFPNAKHAQHRFGRWFYCADR